MRNLAKFLAAFLATTFVACEDVPAPYEIFGGGNQNTEVTSLYYSSSNLYTGWELRAITPEQPWSQGSSYTQATGYQQWDGADTKSNREVTGYLISPKFKTAAAETGKIKIAFDYTLRYTDKVSAWKENHKILVSKDYDGNPENLTNASWTTLDWTPEPSPYTDWTLYPSGEIQLPDEFANQEGVYVAFYFHAPESGSTTWELMNFVICDGIASATGGGDEPGTEEGDIDYTSSNLYSGWNLLAITEGQPWSQGNTYTQATGYQKWDGSDKDKSNREVKGYLISPKFNTAASKTGKVTMNFDYTLRYTNNVNSWKENHKILVSKDYDGNPDHFSTASWTTLDWTPEPSPYSDWTLYPSGDIQLPDEFVNQEGVYVAFYFYAPATGSTTWELMNFHIADGVASAGGDEPGGGNEPGTGGVDADLTKADLCIKATDLKYTNATELTSITVGDIVLTGDKGSNSNPPKYYTSGSALRMYPGNSMTVAAKKKIAKIVLTCVKGSVANNHVEAKPGSVTVADPQVLIDKVDAETVVVTNADTSTGTASQLRWTAIYVFYAE